MEYISLVKPTKERAPSQYAKAAELGKRKSFLGLFSAHELALIRDNFTLTTWLLLGACIQSLLFLYLPISVSVAPAFVLLGLRIGDVLLMWSGLKHNHYMDGVIPGKTAIHFPDSHGTYTGDPANSEICVIVLAARSNHPLGMFAPGIKTLTDYFNANVKALEASPEEHGLLGMSSWVNAGDRAASSESMVIAYFKNVDYLHKFAHGTSHREGWNWWNKTVEEHPYIGLMHEVYMITKHNWEVVNLNYHPAGLGATSSSVVDQLAEKSSPTQTTSWFSPIVEAQKGRLRSSAGRMGRDGGAGNEKYNDDPYAAA
ncbi:hypothetical protein LTR66_010641 [Elasticomyces elasticus]|nr:hypothetical protein LTR66_010641 [Elasticomyces elasticus]